MNILQGYNLVIVAFLSGMLISYIKHREVPEKGTASHIELGMTLAFTAGLVVFFNSQEGIDMVSNVVSSVPVSQSGGIGIAPVAHKKVDFVTGPPDF